MKLFHSQIKIRSVGIATFVTKLLGATTEAH